MPSSQKSKTGKMSLEKVLETTEVRRLKNGLISDQEKETSSRKGADRRYELTRPNSALSRIGVSLEEYKAAPKISPILREIQGGKSKALRAMRFSASPLIQSFLDKYDSIAPRDREKLSLEAIALAAKVDITHLWGEIMLAMREHSVNSVKIIAIANHPDVIKKRVEYAQLPGGFRDRDALDTMLGALPSPKGPTFINKFFAGKSDDEEETKEVPAEVVDDLNYVFPDASAMQERAEVARQKQLGGGK
jgi:hypothetical protein